ncbi:MFS transporter [Erwinia sp. HR93]|uniref:MFS transporter n=1 Tax=Erwinia sp. HR93 TaxID=3094840 RepID=UPI002ADEEA5D|nr:MFS transporter [Erwinia sp. HR93]MEA1063034.1 MFS transporter [Erwinia sp. HR93]
MGISSETARVVQPVKSSWTLALCAGLMGVGQNGLLVMLPQLVTATHLSLSVWAGLLTLGSMLFLPASPWWGRQIEVRGGKFVVLAALGGYLSSFAIMALAVWGVAGGYLPVSWGFAGLIASRLLYGLTVSGMVPAAQTWAMQRAGAAHRMAALATISTGLSCGRLLGPPLAAAALSLNPLAPLWLMACAPLLALLLIVRQPDAAPLPPTATQAVRLQLSMLPYLLLALLLAACISLMQLGLAPALKPMLAQHPTQVSHHVALLLSLAAASTLLAQFVVVRPQRLGAQALVCVAALAMAGGLAVMNGDSPAMMYAGIAITTFGAAMATPGYQLLLNDRLTTGKGAGAIATSHTLGYGASALLVPVITGYYGEQYLLSAALVIALCFLALCGGLWLQSPRQERQ